MIRTQTQHGVSLMETVLVIALTSVLMAPVVTLLQSSHRVWEGYDSDRARIESVNATARILTERLRNADQVLAISRPNNKSGSITMQSTSGAKTIWSRDRRTNTVNQRVGRRNDLLSDNVTELTLVGYEKDGVKKTTVPSKIQVVQFTVATHLDRKTNRRHAVTGWVWLREWE